MAIDNLTHSTLQATDPLLQNELQQSPIGQALTGQAVSVGSTSVLPSQATILQASLATQATSLNSLLSPPSWYTRSIFHSVTSCKDPCNLNGAISYPLANAAGFDSGQLGPWLPAVGTLTWSTPADLRPGVYTFFCRIHPFMRGVFRVIG